MQVGKESLSEERSDKIKNLDILEMGLPTKN